MGTDHYPHHKPNAYPHLWINQRDGTFREEAVARGIGFDGMGHAPANMGVALGDVDGDGLFDIFWIGVSSIGPIIIAGVSLGLADLDRAGIEPGRSMT